MEFLPIVEDHYSQVVEIYLQGISTGIATFQTQAADWADWNRSHLHHCRIGAFEGDILIGWAALSPVSGRPVYAGVAEVSIYIAEDFRGRGVGKKLLLKLIEESESAGIWTLQSGIFSENKASIKLHQQCGFRIVGCRERIGKRDGQWKDNLLLERRSNIVGI